MFIGWLTCNLQVFLPHSLCRRATVNTPAKRQMPIASVVSGYYKKNFSYTDKKKQNITMMKIKVLPITLLLLYSTFVSSQTEAQKAAFQNFKDSCNKELEKQFQKKDYDSALRTVDVAQKRYDNLDNKLKKELNLEDKLFYARASIYAAKNNIELTEQYLIRTAQSGYKDIGWLYYTFSGIYASKNDEKSAVYFLRKAVQAGYKGLCSWQNLIYIPEKENPDFNNELIKLGELKRLSSPNTMPLPWHLTDIRTQLKKDVRLEKLEIDSSVLSDIPNDLN